MTPAEAAKFRPMMRRVAFDRLRHAQDAEDAVQDVFLALLKRPRPDAGPGLLRRMAACRAVDLHRARVVRGWVRP